MTDTFTPARIAELRALADNGSAIAAVAAHGAMLELLDEIERLHIENEKLRAAMEPFARADRAIGDEPGPYRFETGAGYRLIDRESLRRARRAFEGGDA